MILLNPFHYLKGIFYFYLIIFEMNKNECFQLGKLTKTHGLNGEFIIWLDVDFPEDYSDLQSIFFLINDELIPFFIEKLLIRGKKSIVKFEGINSIEETVPYVNTDLYLPLKDLPKLEEDQFYYHEIIGFKLINESDKKEIGKVNAVYEGSGQDLIATKVEEKEVLIPIVDEIIGKVDKNKEIIEVNLPDGLLDIYLNS